ncbi:MAG: response regulator [Pelagimonas sp.]
MVFAFVFLATISAGWIFLDLQRPFSDQNTAKNDNMVSVLSQLGIEIIALELAISQANRTPHSSLEQVRLRYDVLYSRLETIRQNSLYELAPANSATRSNMLELDAFLYRWLPIIDGPADELSAAMPALAQDAKVARARARNLTADALRLVARQNDASRKKVSYALLWLACALILVVGFLALLAGAMFSLARKHEAQAQHALDISEHIKAVIATAQDAVVVTDDTGKVLEFNASASQMFGFAREDAIDHNIADLIIPPYYRDQHDTGMIRARTGQTSRILGKGQIQLEARHKNGLIFPIDLTLARTQTSNGTILIGFLRDISARVQTETDLITAKDRAVAGEKQKAALLAVMSHEMRTPLNGLIGALELFDKGTLDPRHRTYLEIMRTSGETLQRHINSVLDMSRLDAGNMPVDPKSFDLVQLIDEIAESHSTAAEERGNQITVAPMNPDLHGVFSDPGHVRRILDNLISNAVKFTKEGQITVEVDCHRGLEEVEIRVIDTGIGITDADLNRIFDDFVTVDTTYGRGAQGTGLGLGLSSRLAKFLNGTLTAVSEPGAGSAFSLTLPLSPTRRAPLIRPQIDDMAALPPMEILIVEDNGVNRLVARDLLTKDGHAVTEAVDGQDGLDQAAAHKFDLILMDISMPGVDGVEATKQILGGTGPNANTPIVATTAHALPEDTAAFYQAGMCGVIVKPLTLSKLRQGLFDADWSRGGGCSPDALIDDMQLADIRADLGPELYSQSFARFETEMHGFIFAASQEQQTPDHMAHMAQEAHRLVGSASIFGALGISRCLRLLQDSYTAQDTGKIGEQVDNLSTQCDQSLLILAPAVRAPSSGST